jgi:hypothetical protein
LIRDAANGAATTTIRVTAPNGAPEGAPAALSGNAVTAPTVACARDEKVETMQTFLKDKEQITEATVGGVVKPLIVDGCYGDVTEAAIRAYFKKKLIPDDSVPADREQLLLEARDLAGLT